MSQSRCGIPIPVVNPPDLGAGQRCLGACLLAYPANVPFPRDPSNAFPRIIAASSTWQCVSLGVEPASVVGWAVRRTSMLYDALGREQAQVNALGQRTTNVFDAAGQQIALVNALNRRQSFTYDAVNQNSVVLNPFAERTSFSYDVAGKMTVRRLSNGTRTSYIYDANDRRTDVDNRTSAGVAIATFDYRYDHVGNPTSMVEASGDRVTWSYDADNKLLAERRSGASSYANTFTYDAVGNRTRKNANTVRTTFAYDVANQLRYSQATAGRTTFSYDAAGNQTLERPPVGARTTTTWNYENQPTVYRLPNATRMTLSYNPDNRRVQRQHSSETLKFVWDPVADAYQSELNASNVTQAVYTQPPVQFGQIISQRRSTTSSWYHPDSLGSTRALTNSSQTTIDTYLYDAWGSPLSSSGTTVNPFRWVGNVGYYFDAPSGLYYIRARVYQPTIARWTSADPLFYLLAKAGRFSSRDPIGYRAGDNLQFRYVLGRPLAYLDPSGYDWEVLRQGNDKAIAIPSERSDTIAELAALVGLNARESEQWLTIVGSNGMPFPSIDVPVGWAYCDLPDFFVPNTMLSLWAGDLGIFGRIWVFYNGEIRYLRDRGFLVQAVYNGTFSVLNALDTFSSSKELHGFFAWGHGSADAFAVSDGSVRFVEMASKLTYKMGAVLLNSCNSGSGPADDLLVSDGGIFGGHTALLDPSRTGLGCWIRRIADWDYEPSEIIYWNQILKPGDQATQ